MKINALAIYLNSANFVLINILYRPRLYFIQAG